MSKREINMDKISRHIQSLQSSLSIQGLSIMRSPPLRDGGSVWYSEADTSEMDEDYVSEIEDHVSEIVCDEDRELFILPTVFEFVGKSAKWKHEFANTRTMGFGADFQGKASHEALLRLQDCEIRLLDNMKRCLTVRIDSDRKYAASLSSIVQQAQKLEPTEFQGHCSVFRAWDTIIIQTDRFIKLLRQNVEEMSSKTLDKLNDLINEKKAARRYYLEERNKLDQDFTKVQDDVLRHKHEYSKCLQRVSQDQAKYNDVKLKGKSGAKLDDVKTKFQRSTAKLHKVHNDYVLSLKEVMTHQTCYLTQTLPAFLDSHQTTQESLIHQCKDILQQYHRLTNFSNEDCSSVFQSMDESIQLVVPETEYREQFISEYKSDPLEATNFSFDSGLLTDYSGALQNNKLTVDDLTQDVLTARHSVLEEELANLKKSLQDKESQLTELESRVQELESRADDIDDSQSELANKRREQDKQKFEISVIKSKISTTEEVSTAIEMELQQTGNSVPVALDTSLSSSPPETPEVTSPSSASKLKTGLSRLAKGVLRSKQSADKDDNRGYEDQQLPEARNTTNGPSSGSTSEVGKKRKVSAIHSPAGNNGEVSDKAPGSPIRPKLSKDECTKLKPVVPRSKPRSPVTARNAEVPTRPLPPSRSNTNTSTAGSVTELSHDLPADPNIPLEEEEWFHGVLPREEVQRLLVNDGDFIVRESKNRKTNETQYVLSVSWQGYKHFIIQYGDGGWRFEGPSFPTIHELVMHQYQSGQEVTSKSKAILRKAILRERWQLKNDDIALEMKIGNGNFGEVYRGIYKANNQVVAVKTCRDTLSEDQRKKFLMEGRILKQYDHPNIVRFIGIAAQRQPVMIVMEYVAGGALLNYLRRHGKSQTKKQLTLMCENAANGMAYLESKNCIHRDLAARNCLVGDKNVVKISDFGMSREEEEYTVSEGLKQIPIKWTAPEALMYGKYTSMCDVWSFGILMWEVFSGGQTPYSGMSNNQARDKVDGGYRMPAPEGTPDAVYELMKKTWEYIPSKRPHFTDIYKELKSIVPRL